MNDIMEIFYTLEDCNILFKGVTETIKNDKRILRNTSRNSRINLARKFIIRKGIVRAGSENKRKWICKSWLWKRMGFLILPRPLTKFEIQKYYQNELRFNGVFSRDNLPKATKDGVYVINLDEYADIGTHWIALFCRKTEVEIKNYRNKFDSFGLEHVSEETKEFVGNKSIKANIFRAQANYSIMCGSYCIGFIDFMYAGKKFADLTNLLSPYDFEKK